MLAIVNGTTETLSSLATKLTLDKQGELSLIVATDSVAGRALTFSNVYSADGKKVNITEIRSADGNRVQRSTSQWDVDPSRKVLNAFSEVKVDTDLKQLKTKTGKPLYADVKKEDMPSQNDLKMAAKCFAKINEAVADFNEDGRAKKDSVTAMANGADTGHQITLAFSSPVDWFMDGFNELKQVWHKVEDFFVDKVWKKIRLGVRTLMEFAGFLFMWDDIKACKNTISSFLTGGLDLGAKKLEDAEKKVENFFDGLVKKIDERSTPGAKVAAKSDGQSHDDDQSVSAQRSTCFKWVGERLKNGGARSGTLLEKPKDSVSPSWEEIFKPIGQSLQDSVKDITHDLTNIFHAANSFTNQELWSKLGTDFLKGAVEAIKTFVVGLLKLGEKLLNSLNWLGNKDISIPVISALWEKILGHPLTAFDAISLIIAIPTTILIKLLAGNKPHTFPNMGADFLASLGNQPDDVKADLAIFGSAAGITCSVLIDLFNFMMLTIQLEVGGAAAGVDYMSPNKVVLVLKSVFQVLSIVFAMPSDNTLPRTDLRKWTGYMGIAAVGSKLLFTFTSIGGDDSQKKMEILDCLIAVVNFGLWDAVFAAELDSGAQYRDKDDMITGCGIVENVFNTLASAGRCVAYQFAQEDEEVALAGLLVMQASGQCLTVNKGLTFSRVSHIKARSARSVNRGT
ncbi:hypothetical protein LTR60_003243 [Cryomyces antarcticus]|nr:hypothetical protein LTR39_003315 [Cryomyces antarcticus]KAK5014664.1 hypothetical protein LTR60_003243 [Cryomyces antarcticus]